MSAASPSPGAGGETGRVRCLYCGANNFPSSPTCWQCGRPLQAARSGPSAGSPASSPVNASPPPVLPTASRPAPILAAAAPGALAPKAAAALGLMFPLVGLPVGIVFLMLDDPRKTQIGWIVIGWSAVGSVLNIVATLAVLGPTLSILRNFLPPTARPGGGSGLPTGLPDLSGGTEILLPTFMALLRAFARLLV